MSERTGAAVGVLSSADYCGEGHGARRARGKGECSAAASHQAERCRLDAVLRREAFYQGERRGVEELGALAVGYRDDVPWMEEEKQKKQRDQRDRCGTGADQEVNRGEGFVCLAAAAAAGIQGGDGSKEGPPRQQESMEPQQPPSAAAAAAEETAGGAGGVGRGVGRGMSTCSPSGEMSMLVGAASVSTTCTMDEVRTSQTLRFFWSPQDVRMRASLLSQAAQRIPAVAPIISTGAELGWFTSKMRRIWRHQAEGRGGGRGAGGSQGRGSLGSLGRKEG